MEERAACGPTRPSPVAKTPINSPGKAGLSEFTGAPATLAQHRLELMAVMVSVAVPVLITPVEEVLLAPLAVAAIARPLPSLPGTFARRTMRVKEPDGAATTFSSGLALINATSASRTVLSVSVARTV